MEVKMKTKLLAVITIILIFSPKSFALEFKSKQPILITSAGQSADVIVVKIVAKKTGLKFTIEKFAKPANLKNHASLIFASGGSSKGLGAAKIDKQKELDRVKSLIASAKEQKINIITMHTGGKARRGKLSDEFNKLTAESSDYLIVVRTGDEDQFFSKIAKQRHIPIKLVDKIMDTGEVLKNIFSQKAK